MTYGDLVNQTLASINDSAASTGSVRFGSVESLIDTFVAQMPALDREVLKAVIVAERGKYKNINFLTALEAIA